MEIDPARAAGYGLSNSYISQILAGQNLIYPGGDLENGSKTLTVSTDAKFQSVEDVSNTLIALPAGGVVRLNEVADVSLKDQDTENLAKVGTSPCVVLQISKQSGANELEVSIVVLENINRFYAEGHDRMSACLDGTKEVTASVVASTLTTEAVFVPLGMVEGIAGDMFRDFSLTIASLIFASLLISLTLVPLMCDFTLNQETAHRRQLRWKKLDHSRLAACMKS